MILGNTHKILIFLSYFIDVIYILCSERKKQNDVYIIIFSFSYDAFG